MNSNFKMAEFKKSRVKIVNDMIYDFESLIPNKDRSHLSLRYGGSRNKLPFTEDSVVDDSDVPSVFSSTLKQDDVGTESPNRKRQREADLIKAKSKIARLESKVLDFETTRKTDQIEHEKQLKAMKLEHQCDKTKKEELQLQLKQLLERETELVRELTEVKRSLSSSKEDCKQRVTAAEKERDELKFRLEEQVAQLKEHTVMLESDLHRELREKIELKTELECCAEQILNLETKAAEVNKEMLEAENIREEQKAVVEKNKALESKLKMLEDSGKLVKILEREVAAIPELEKENKKLKEENRILSMREENVMLLNEELEGSKATVERLEKLCADLPKLRHENEDLKHKLGEWEKLSVVGCDSLPPSAHNAAKAIARLQQQEIVLLEKIGSLTTSLHSSQAKVNSLTDEVKTLNETLQRKDIILKQNADHIRHLRKKQQIIIAQRNIFSELLKKYDCESTVISGANESATIQQQESVINGYREMVDTLEQQLKSANEKLVRLGFDSGAELLANQQKTDEERKSLKTKVAELEHKVLELEEEKTKLELRLEHAVMKGEVNPFKTRVLHFTSNPVHWQLQERMDELMSAKEEIKTLKQKLNVLGETSNQNSHSHSVKETSKDASSQDNSDLLAQLEQMNGKHKRLMEAFKKISSEFREVTYTLLGFNIEMPYNGQYKLTNMYAESQDDYLLFLRTDNGQLQLLETPYSSSLQEKIQLYLETQNSIPALLSSLTLELFNSQTTII